MINPRDKIHRWLSLLLWAFILSLLFDGALRKWFFPGLSDILLLSRLPIVAAIYLLALSKNIFPVNRFIIFVGLLAILTTLTGYLAHGNYSVLAYGIITNFLFIPLIFIFPKVWNKEDVQRVGKFVLIVGIPMTALIALQFYQPQSAWVNRSVGGAEGAGFTGALGRYRPPGTFSFITGVAQFYTLYFAFFLSQFIEKRTLKMALLVVCGACVPLAVFGSISRLLALSVAVVFILGIIALLINGRRIPNSLKVLAAMVVFTLMAGQLPFFHDATDAFSARWERATGEERGGFREAILARTLGELTGPFARMDRIPFWGYGLGTGTQAGSQLLAGQRGFILGEGEWSRVMSELGPLLGVLFIAYRVVLVLFLGKIAMRQLRFSNFLPWLIFSAIFLLIFYGQWGQQTTLGFAILGAGLMLSACLPTKRKSSQNVEEAIEVHG